MGNLRVEVSEKGDRVCFTSLKLGRETKLNEWSWDKPRSRSRISNFMALRPIPVSLLIMSNEHGHDSNMTSNSSRRCRELSGSIVSIHISRSEMPGIAVPSACEPAIENHREQCSYPWERKRERCDGSLFWCFFWHCMTGDAVDMWLSLLTSKNSASHSW